MKKLSMLILMLAMITVLAVSASASLVMYQDGAANMNTTQGATGALNIEIKIDEPINVYDYDYMYVRFYIEDPEAYINNGQIELTSSGTCDNAEANWDLNSFEMVQGWNEWQIDLYTGGSSGGMLDYENANYFRVYAFTDGSNLIAIDYVAFGNDGEDFSSIATEFGEEVVIEEYVPEDVVTRVAEGDSGAINVNGIMALNPVNISDYDYAFLRIYVEGADNFNGDGQLELTSKGTCDIEEMHWMVGNLGLVDGWNEIMIDLYLPDAMDSAFNWEACNYFRMYQFIEGSTKFELDYLGFGMETDVFGEDTLPAYLIKPASQDPVVEEETAEATEETPAETPVEATEVVEEAPAETPAEAAEVVEETPAETPAEAAEVVEEAPQTFDLAVLAALAAIVSAAGYAISKKR